VNLFYQPLLPDGVFFLDQEESRHCLKVLRKKTGDDILITDGKGTFYNAVITGEDYQKCHFKVKDSFKEQERDYSIHIAISPTKNADRLEWFVEKAVELGVDHITVMECENTERTFVKKERLDKVAISAMKQSLKARIPVITSLVKFADVVDKVSEPRRYIAYVDVSNADYLQKVADAHQRYIVLIGPEGDFTNGELAMAQTAGFAKVSLGQSRLRTETAGMAACHILNLVNASLQV
jgi:16S rRNA (uracil1498-N3)-methyltransferase